MPFRRVETAMKIARRAGVVLGSVIAAVATMAASLPASAPTPTWQMAATVHYGPAANASGYSAVVAPGKDDAWVFGGTNPGGASSPAAEHWDGRRWHAWSLPAGLSGFIVAAAASSPGDIWAVGGGYALHWNGARWAVAKTWSQAGETTSVVVVSPGDVWVFGSSSFSGETSLGAWHYNGHAWARARGVAGAIYRASALSPRDIWAITISPRGGSVVHYDGRTWAREAAADSALADTQLDDVLAVSARSVWVSGVSPANAADGHLVLARWNGRSWKRFVAPWLVQQPERFAADGAGGIWIPVVTGGQSPATWILHLSRTGAWTRTRIAAAPGTGVGVGDLALIPGTTTLWGTGGLLTAAGGSAAIWEHGIPGFHLAVRERWPAFGRGPQRSRLMLAGRGEVLRVYLTGGDRGMIQVYLRARYCRAFGRGLWPARGGRARELIQVRAGRGRVPASE
jgi:hypothetical protein